MSFTDELELTLGPFSPSLISLKLETSTPQTSSTNHSPSEHRQVLGEPVPVLGQQVPLDPVHEVLEPGHHGGPLVPGLGGDDLVSEVLKGQVS